jgi:hypothetical protein
LSRARSLVRAIGVALSRPGFLFAARGHLPGLVILGLATTSGIKASTGCYSDQTAKARVATLAGSRRMSSIRRALRCPASASGRRRIVWIRANLRLLSYLQGQAARTCTTNARNESRVVHQSKIDRRMAEMGLASRVTPVHTALRNSTRDEGGPFGFDDSSRSQATASCCGQTSHGGERCGKGGT